MQRSGMWGQRNVGFEFTPNGVLNPVRGRYFSFTSNCNP
ncbi:hypothetical protein Barb4_00545 [Bacteroidales bacterium Barb4]|nr:hypothetical protein Barb4_00545 [Bacteroidales bacterium Barb4]